MSLKSTISIEGKKSIEIFSKDTKKDTIPEIIELINDL